jgi:hypothetical protein
MCLLLQPLLLLLLTSMASNSVGVFGVAADWKVKYTCCCS